MAWQRSECGGRGGGRLDEGGGGRSEGCSEVGSGGDDEEGGGAGGGGGEDEHLQGAKLCCFLRYPQSAPLLRSIWIAMLLIALLVPVSCLPLSGGAGNINCFVCTSINGNNPACEDPFHNNYTANILHSPCKAGRKNRAGLFPATTCLKMAGYDYLNGSTLVVRSCALDSGTLTTDTEIIRMSHCGSFYFNNRYIKGCLQSCDDSDGCNGVKVFLPNILIVPLCLALTLLRSYMEPT